MTEIVNCLYTEAQYKKLLTFSFENGEFQSKGEFLASAIFNLTTYDGGLDNFFVDKIINICEAINNKTTFEFIKDADNYTWYIAILNMKFFESKLNWGTSIRGAWWEDKIIINSCGLYLEEGDDGYTDDAEDGRWNQLLKITIQGKHVDAFFRAVINFYRE